MHASDRLLVTLGLLCVLQNSIVLAQNSVEEPQASAATQKLKEIQQSLLLGAREVAAAAKAELKGLDQDSLSTKEKEQWVRLARESAIRLADKEWLESLADEEDPFESQIIYRVLLASGQLEKGAYAEALATLDKLGDMDLVNEREKRRVYAIRARIAQIQRDLPEERKNIEAIIDHLDRWPTEDCQSCHNILSNPKVITTLPIHRLWFGERFVELLHEQGDTKEVLATAEKQLQADPTNIRAKIYKAYALQAAGKKEESQQLFDSIPWVESNGKTIQKPRMMTTFP